MGVLTGNDSLPAPGQLQQPEAQARLEVGPRTTTPPKKEIPVNVLTVPKRAAVLEYSLLRLPATVLQKQVVVRFLQDDSALRLGFERALGSLDEKAGRLLDDQALITRGSALRRRTEVLADAARLEESAAQRTADADLQQEQARVAAERTQAEKARRDGLKKAAAAKTVAKKRVAAATAAREKAETARVQAEAKDKADSAAAKAEADAAKAKAEADADAAKAKADADAAKAKAKAEADADADADAAKAKADAATARIAAEEKAVTAAPKAQPATAIQEKADAGEQRAKADTLATPADAQKAGRAEA